MVSYVHRVGGWLAFPRWLRLRGKVSTTYFAGTASFVFTILMARIMRNDFDQAVQTHGTSLHWKSHLQFLLGQEVATWEVAEKETKDCLFKANRVRATALVEHFVLSGELAPTWRWISFSGGGTSSVDRMFEEEFSTERPDEIEEEELEAEPFKVGANPIAPASKEKQEHEDSGHAVSRLLCPACVGCRRETQKTIAPTGLWLWLCLLFTYSFLVPHSTTLMPLFSVRAAYHSLGQTYLLSPPRVACVSFSWCLSAT